MYKNNYKTHTRKLRQLKFLSKKLQQVMAAPNHFLSAGIEGMIRKIKNLIAELQGFVAGAELRKVVGATAVVLGFTLSQGTNAQTTFTTNVQNPFGLTGGTEYFSNAAVADFDNDGDKDFITGEWYGRFYYFQNTGTVSAPNFAAPVMNPFGLTNTADTAYHTITVADLDNDGDKDLMVGSYIGAHMYYQNVGTATAPSFTTPVANPFGLADVYYLSAPTFVDYDNDGDWDVVTGEYPSNLQFFQNTGTASLPAFASPVQNMGGITATGTIVAHPTFGDLDNDGDLDLMVGDKAGKTFYYQSTGTAAVPAFAAPLTNPYGLTTVTKVSMPKFVNFDNDSDLDLLIADYDGNFNYFQNVTTPTGLNPVHVKSNVLVVYPNPATDFISVKGQASEFIASVEVMDVTGRVVASQKGNKPVNVKDLAAGMYTVKITSESGTFEMTQIQKQ
jgi:hypothetical protein